MRELELLEIINKTLSDSSFLGDDCAFLEEFGLCVTQDTLVENVHFSLKTTSPYYLGRKAVAVNLSDLAAGLSTPKYITVSVSLPKSLDNTFITEFYKGINDICNEYSVKVAGGDITGSEKVFISITAIGKNETHYKSSRSLAKENDLIITTGNYGASALGLFALKNSITTNERIINAHINPIPRIKESNALSKVINRNIAAMDTSDGFMDAIFKIANSSGNNIEIEFEKIPIEKDVIEIAAENNIDHQQLALWGGEDYELIAAINENEYQKLPQNTFKIIGKVKNKSNSPEVTVNSQNDKLIINKEIFKTKSYNHFQ